MHHLRTIFLSGAVFPSVSGCCKKCTIHFFPSWLRVSGMRLHAQLFICPTARFFLILFSLALAHSTLFAEEPVFLQCRRKIHWFTVAKAREEEPQHFRPSGMVHDSVHKAPEQPGERGLRAHQQPGITAMQAFFKRHERGCHETVGIPVTGNDNAFVLVHSRKLSEERNSTAPDNNQTYIFYSLTIIFYPPPQKH